MKPRTATGLAALALAAGIGLAGTAGAAPFFTLAGGADVPDIGNDFAFIAGTGAIIRESQVGNVATISVTGPGNIRIEYIGKEALFSNSLFNWGALAGGLLVSDTGPNPPQIVGDTVGIPPAPPPATSRSSSPTPPATRCPSPGSPPSPTCCSTMAAAPTTTTTTT